MNERDLDLMIVAAQQKAQEVVLGFYTSWQRPPPEPPALTAAAPMMPGAEDMRNLIGDLSEMMPETSNG